MRVKFTTTINEETLKALDLIGIEQGLPHRNDVIEFLVKEYLEYNETVGGVFDAFKKKNEPKQ